MQRKLVKLCYFQNERLSAGLEGHKSVSRYHDVVNLEILKIFSCQVTRNLELESIGYDVKSL